ncbi:MAG: translation initiation factor IF-2, partial [Planctomycetes bacterium]|nr:translation initiation factor IF-2 [Planctomycetota bacterium]
MKIRIFALAKELDMDSKELISYCQQAGIDLKPSALASISPEERDMVLRYIEEHASVGAASQAEAIKPVREATRAVGKVRQLDVPRRASRTQAIGGDDDGRGGTATAVAEAPDELEDEIAGLEGTAPEVGDDELEADEPAAAAAAETEETVLAEESLTQEAGVEGEVEEGTGAMRRSDYVPASGASTRSIRNMEMRPRGTIPESEEARRSRQKKARPALPSVAAPPTYKAPKIKKPEEKAETPQKPDLQLTPEVLEGQSPLRDRLRRVERRKRGEVEAPPDLRGRRPPTVPEEEARPKRRPRRRQQGGDEGFEDRRRSGGIRRRKRTGPVEFKSSAIVQFPITVRGLSETLGRPANQLIKSLWNLGQMVTINDPVPEETAVELAMDLGVDLQIKRQRDLEVELAQTLEAEEPPENLQPRPPMVTILGHVDHGKTTLLDKIRSANVAGGEAGGITQHIAAYQVEHNGQKITFVDTPGHAAFGEMRARGANVTDIVVLVVAADDGVMPQTEECISHARNAGVPMVVAMNKVDLPDVNQQRVLQELAAREILPAEWGGDTEVVRTSAVTGEGIEKLLETLLVTAELNEYRANPERNAVGVCLEAFRDEGRGVLAWFIVQKGTLRVGDVVVCGESYGRIRSMYNDLGAEIDEAPPSTPVKVSGLGEVPAAGQHFFVMEDIESARQVAEDRHHLGRTETLARRLRPRTLEDILNAARGGAVQDLPLIVKADTPGSIEALRGELEKFEHPEVRVEIVHTGVGGVNESDVSLASASGAIIAAFHVIPEDRARQLAEREGVDIRRYSIIYEVTADIKRALEGLLAPERRAVTTGRAL